MKKKLEYILENPHSYILTREFFSKISFKIYYEVSKTLFTKILSCIKL